VVLLYADPTNAQFQYDIGVTHEAIGDVLMAQRDPDAALFAYRTSQEVGTRLGDRVIQDLRLSCDVPNAALDDSEFLNAATRAAEIITNALLADRKILFAGNDGSAADAKHLATELVVRFVTDRPALPAIALTTDGSLFTAADNDLGFEHMFSRQVLGLGQNGDVFVALSTSGRSPNILAAAKAARERGLTVIGFTGAKGDALAALCDVTLRVPSTTTALIQQVHMAAGHTICAIAEEAFAKRS
jgi:D-sedoheptulose 7-phosphate isomerase